MVKEVIIRKLSEQLEKEDSLSQQDIDASRLLEIDFEKQEKNQALFHTNENQKIKIKTLEKLVRLIKYIGIFSLIIIAYLLGLISYNPHSHLVYVLGVFLTVTVGSFLLMIGKILCGVLGVKNDNNNNSHPIVEILTKVINNVSKTKDN